MNANTRLRLWKEARALLPMWAGVSALMIVPFLITSRWNQIGLATFAFVFGCAVLGSICVGQEFQHRTMAGLLAQPVSRRRIWWEKLAVSGVAFSLLSLLLLLLAWFYLRRSGFGDGYWHEARLYAERGTGTLTGELWRYIEFFQKSAENCILFALTSLGQSLGFLRADPYAYRELRWTPELVWVVALFLVPPVLGFCTGPTCTLLARSALGGAALTFLGPCFLMIVGVLLIKAFADEVSSSDESAFFFYYALFAGAIYAGAMFLYGCRRFARLEDVSLLAQEFAAPRQFNSLFAWLTSGLAPGRDSQLANLLRKEVRLQRPAVFMGAFVVALWLAFIAVRQVYPALSVKALIIPSIWLALGIPVIAGIVAVAEERSLGVHEWHLTLPVSARRQWCVKVIVALGVNAVLGLLLPGLLAHASSWLANNPQLVAEIPGRNVSPLLVANLVIFCAALYASTASANSMRALVGTIVLFLAGAMVLNFADFVAAFHPLQAYAATPVRDYLAVGDILGWLHSHRWPLGWSCLAVWLYFLGLAGFRRSLESFWLPVRRMAVFFAVVCAFVFAAIVW